MTNVSDYPVTVDGRRLDDLAVGLETSSLTLGGLRSADQPLAGLDGEVPSLNDSREPSTFTLGMLVKGTDADGFVPAGKDAQAVYQSNLEALKHLLCRTGALLDVRRVVDKATSLSRTNLTPNPSFRATNGTAEIRRNTVLNPAMTTDTTGWAFAVGTSGTGNGTRVVGGGPVVGGQTLNYYRCTWATISTGVVPSTGPIFGNPNATQVAVTPNVPNAISVYARCSVANRTAQMTVTFHDAANAQVGLANNAAVAIGGAGWTRLSVVATPPATAVRAYVRCYAAGGTNWQVGDTMDATGALCEALPDVLPYMDGANVASDGLTYSWTGVAGASASIATGKALVEWVGARLWQGADGASMRVITTGAATSVYQTTAIPAVPGDQFAASFKVQADTAGDMARIRTYHYAPGIVAALNGPDTVVTALTTLSGVGPAAPAGTVGVRSVVQFADTGGHMFTVRESLLERAAAVGAFFDGSSGSGYGWTGLPDQSPSLAVSSDVRADAKVVDSITPDDAPGDYGRLAVALKLPGVYWRSLQALAWTSGALTSGQWYPVGHLDGSSAPIDDAIIVVTGPANAGVQVFDTATLTFVRLNEAIPAGQAWRINCDTWESRVGVGLTTESADTAGTDKSGVTDQSGLYPRLLRLNPRLIGAVRRVQVSVTGTGFSAATTLTIKARRAHL